MERKIYKIISRYLAGEASSADMEILRKWMAEDDKNAGRIELLRKFWNTSGQLQKPETSFEEFFERIESSERKRRFRHRVIGLRPITVAASVALFAAVSASMFFIGKNLWSPTEYYTFVSSHGVERLTLPDSTVVYLNAESRLTYTDRYDRERKVRIEGEAYFDVVKGRGTFTVDVGDNASIEVLGTSFNVLAFPGDGQVVTTLEEGSVRFVQGKSEIMLKPDEQLVYDRDTRGCLVSEVDAMAYSSWKEPVYRYARITMSALCSELERIYGLEISLNPRLENIMVSGSFERRDDIEMILKVMEKRMKFSWTRKGNHIQIE